MNILFLVMNFLLIFLFLNASVLKNGLFFSVKQSSSCSYLSSKTSLQSKWEVYKYKRYLQGQFPPKKGEKKATSSSKIITSFPSHRMRDTIPLTARWNISTVLTADLSSALFLKKCTKALLIEIYGHTFFWKEASEEIPDLAEAFLSSFLENKENIETLSDLFPQDERLHNAFYKMLKGSGLYSIAQKKGYPPLSEVFGFDTETSTLTNFPYATYPILKALFQEEVLNSILDLEKKKWEKDMALHSLTKEEIRQLCLYSGLIIKEKQFSELEPFLSFSYKKAKLDKLTHTDKKTHIHLKMTLPTKTSAQEDTL